MNLLRAVGTVSGMTLLSRITGLARESLKAFAEGAFAQAFVPIFAEYRRQRGEAETHELVSRVGTLLAVVLLVVTALGVLAAPWLVYALASGFARTPGNAARAARSAPRKRRRCAACPSRGTPRTDSRSARRPRAPGS